MFSTGALFSKLPEKSLTDKCIVLDLDLTLVCTQDSLKSLDKLQLLANSQNMDLRCRSYYFTLEDFDKYGVNETHSMWGITRPHMLDFLRFCFHYFRIVAVWSAGTKGYVQAIVEKIFRDIHPPHIIFTADDTIIRDDYIEKPLSRMMATPLMRKVMHERNTLVIDDNSTTITSNPHNAILVPAYEPSPTVEDMRRDDLTLLHIKDWLLTPEVMHSSDVLKLDKQGLMKRLRMGR